jgi:very-short-patch-repair endonuclease
MYSKIKIICPVHGEFDQLPVKHLLGQGCKICNLTKRNNLFRMSKESFIQYAKNIHGDLYDYSKVAYINNRTNVEIICKTHGSFFQRPHCHIKRDHGCPKCQQSHGEKIIEQFLKEHNILYINEYRFKDCRNIKPLPFDFYLQDKNICIEYDGLQHFKITNWGNDLIKRQKLDRIKTDYCQQHNILLIRISYKEKNHISNILEKYLI